jgi:hypothetical protein
MPVRGGGGGSFFPSEPPIVYEETGNLNTDSEGIVGHSVEIDAKDGVASLFVPAGVKALDKNGKPLIDISIKPTTEEKMPEVPAGAIFQFAGYAYEAGPAGATFNPGITLTLEIPDDVWETLDPNNQQFTVKWDNPESGLWEEIQTTISPGTRTVTATITHFSTYALFTEPGTTPVTPTETAITTAAPGEEPPAEGLPGTMILLVVIVAIIAGAGYFFIAKKK